MSNYIKFSLALGRSLQAHIPKNAKNTVFTAYENLIYFAKG